MDSFTMLFRAESNDSDIAQTLRDDGFDARSQGSGSVFVPSGEACVWIQIMNPAELDPSDFEDEQEWPIARDQVGSLCNISVRRNMESVILAVKIAAQLVTIRGGAILWDGMDSWEERYKAYLGTNGSIRQDK